MALTPNMALTLALKASGAVFVAASVIITSSSGLIIGSGAAAS
jgi:hypothetical protein